MTTVLERPLVLPPVPDLPALAAPQVEDAPPPVAAPTEEALAGPESGESGELVAERVEDAADSVLRHPAVAVAEEPRASRRIEALEARRLVLEAWREARLSSPSGRVHFLTMIDSWLVRGWGIAFYTSGTRVMLYSFGAAEAWLPTDLPPRRLTRPRGSGRLAGVYQGEALFPGGKGDYQVPGVAEGGSYPFVAELAIGVRGDELYLMPHEDATRGVAHIAAALSARTYGEARELGLDVDDRRRCLDYYVELCCRAHEDVDEQFLRARSTQDLWNAIRPADDQPFDVDEHPCYAESRWRPMPTVRGPWADAEFRERFGPIERDWETGLERIAAEHVNDALAHLRDHGWSVGRDDDLFAAFWPDA